MMSASLLSAGLRRWTPARLPALYVYDDATRTAAHDLGTSSENLSELTVMCWINPSSTSGYRGVIVGRGDAGAEHWRTDQNSSEVRGIENGSNFGLRGSTFTAGVWTHVAWRFYGAGTGDSQRLRLWVDGTEYTPSYIGTIPASLASRAGKNWWLGRFTDGSSAWSSFGSIAQTIICGAALDPADIVRAYTYTLARR